MFYVLVAFRHLDTPFLAHKDMDVPVGSQWMRVSREEYCELLAEGFVVAMAWGCTEGECR